MEDIPAHFAIGTLVRLVGLPGGLRDDDDLATKSLFEACLGRTFPVMGLDRGLVELHVGHVLGQPSYLHSIYVEPDFLEPAADPG